MYIVLCYHGDKHVHLDFTLESMEDEKALSYYSYRTTSVAERVKNYPLFGITDLFLRRMYIYFINCLQTLTVNALGEYKIKNDLEKKKMLLSNCSVLGFYMFLPTKE